MKYLLILFTVFTFGQASNQMVTFTQASTLGFTLNTGQSHVTSNQCMTKSDALAKYNLSAESMNGYANNQLVPRSAWVGGVAGNCYYLDISWYGSTPSEACNNSAIFDPIEICFQDTTLENVPLPSGVTANGVAFNGDNLWWRVSNGSDTYVFLISSAGVASQREQCINRTQQYIYKADPCSQAAAMVFLDSNGLYYNSASGGSALNATLYSYNQPNPPLFTWNVWNFTNGVLSFDGTVDSECALD